MTRSHVLLLFAFQLLCVFAYSQNPNIKFERFGLDDGISNSNVLCILQDKRGFMWFGTKDGLNRYDGYKFTVYKSNHEEKMDSVLMISSPLWKIHWEISGLPPGKVD